MKTEVRVHRALKVEELEARSAPALMITGVDPSGGAGTPFDSLEVYFNEDVQDGTFTIGDVALGGGPGSVSTVNKITATHYQIVCAGTGLDTTV